ncbi:hypothetical protein PR202_ga24917 [Eleusine coracana subsp. coracana]|uniref:Uncharacterized protein n=1 Tax=Eleusine coracana subsp. coracana TaxID=191504 RepID=A0AAV5D8Y6_ELECO|nr:hypothetical protein PR202_ga24917 [Eleusine coracana subsp. coracana]
MEASVLSATLNVLANKLAPLVIKQYSSIVGVTEDLKELKDLVEEINCLLERIGYEAKRNYPSLNWLKKLKDVAYTADDIVDEFQLKAEEHDAALATNGGIISNMWIKPKSFIFQCKAASKVKAIKKEFATIVKQRTDFSAIANSLLESHPIHHINNAIVEMPSLPIVDEALVLGRDEEKHKIISKLVETNDQHGIKVVSIIGLGGSGKTTLAKLIFNDDKIIAKHFEVRLWVHVSQEFDAEKLVQKLFESFSDNDSGQYKLPYMSKTISDKLTGKRFLLVLDDVWTESQTQWEEFIIYLKSGTPGSRVLLTTRSSSSAETVPLQSTYLFDLPLLSQDDSWQLFKQSLRMPAEVWRFEFEDVGKEIVKLPEGIGNLKNLVVMNLEGCRGLESMPVGIGQLSQLRKLGLFAVKEGESFAKISELGNIGKIDGELTIRGIARGMDPYEAQKACLKRNTNLRSLTLMWETNGRVNTENELLVLHYLEPPDAIKCLEVHGYAGLLYPWWLLKQGGHLRFPRLSILELSDFPKLKHLHELVELPCLEKLILTGMPRLESISGGPFPSLAKFYMQKLPRLGELWLVTERSLVVGEEGSDCINSIPLTGLLQIGNYLSRLVISECPELKIKPYMPISLQDLMLDGANEQLLQSPGQGQESSWFSSDADLRPSLLNFGHLMELRLWSMTVASSSSSTSVSGFGCEREPLQHLMELETLQISNFNCLTELPESMWSLTSLQSLTIAYCSALVQLPERLGELCSLKGLWIEGLPGLRSFPQSLQHLTSLVSLNIGGCDALYHLPECVGELHSLTHFEIWNLPGLTSLPQSMRRLTSLEELSITECPGLTSLPEWISELTSLELLDISGCPVLMRRYEKGKGEDCHLTAHIPFIF